MGAWVLLDYENNFGDNLNKVSLVRVFLLTKLRKNKKVLPINFEMHNPFVNVCDCLLVG